MSTQKHSDFIGPAILLPQLITNNRDNLHSGLKMCLYLTCTRVDVLICSTVLFHSDFCGKTSKDYNLYPLLEQKTAEMQKNTQTLERNNV